MIKRKFRLFWVKQTGLTLIELIVALAIVSVIIVGTGMAFVQIITSTAKSNNHMQAVRQVQNSGFWISRDIQQAESISEEDNVTTPALEVLTINWDYTFYEYGHEKHLVIYTLQDRTLTRQDTLNDVTTSSMLVAQDINSIDWNGSNRKLIVVATVGDFQQASETREYSISPRTQ